MSSARGLLGHPAGYTAYCASKSAIDGITKALGCEWGDTGITVNAHRADGLPLAAHRLDVRGHRARHDVRKGFLARVPKGRLGEPSDLAGPAAVPRLEGVGFLHRPHPLRRRRLHGGLTHGHKARIAVVGAGLMGHGIAQVFALAGHDGDDLRPVAGEPRHRARRASPPICAISATIEARSSACTPCADLADGGARRRLRGRGGARKILPLKQKLFAEIERHVRPDTILASNTSVIPITDDHAGLARARARARHPLVESAVPGAAGRGDRHAMDVAAGDRLDDGAARRCRQEAGACEEGRARLHRQPAAACAVARGDLAGRARHLRRRDRRHRDQGRASAAGSRCSGRWRTPTWSAPT